MFGYITVNKDELKLRDFRRYHSLYCGLCRVLKKRFGTAAQMTLTYDMTFLVTLLNGLYEIPLTEEKHFCKLHPGRRQETAFNEISEYAADMSVLLSYYKCADDVRDDRSAKAKAWMRMLRKSMAQTEARYPEKTLAIQRALLQLTQAEQRGEKDLDVTAGLSGEILGEVFVWKDDEWADELQRMGYYLGKYVYLLDAYDDLDEDLKKNRYNPWRYYMDRKDFEALVENTLTIMISDCAREFEKLPIIQDIDILRNVIYSGVWSGYRKAQERREKEKGETR